MTKSKKQVMIWEPMECAGEVKRRRGTLSDDGTQFFRGANTWSLEVGRSVFRTKAEAIESLIKTREWRIGEHRKAIAQRLEYIAEIEREIAELRGQSQ